MVKDDGWITDIQTGKKINATKEYGLRLGADIHPSEALHSLTFINYNYGDDGGTGYVAIAMDPTSFFASSGAAAAFKYPAPLTTLVQQQRQTLGFYQVSRDRESTLLNSSH